MSRYISNDEHGAGNLVAWALLTYSKYGEIDANFLALAAQIDEKINQLKNDLLGGAGEAFDTLKELADLIATNTDSIDALRDLAAGHVKFDEAQALTESQKTQARDNIGAVDKKYVDDLVNDSISTGPTVTVKKEGSVATITATDRNGTTKASISDGERGFHYTPILDDDGNLSWTNDGGLINPDSKNIKGPKGDPGPQGEPGSSGTDGAVGPQGPKGDKGDTGPQGYTFTPSVSSSGVISWTNNGNLQNPAAISIKGPKGDKGTTGDTGPQGPKGDPFIYEDFTSEQLEALTGPQGPKGDKGDTGPQGPKGDTPDMSLYLTKNEYNAGFDGGTI